MTEHCPDDTPTLEEIHEYVGRLLEDTIELHRAARQNREGPEYDRPMGPPTDEEVYDCIASSPFLPPQEIEHLLDPYLPGFGMQYGTDRPNWLDWFSESMTRWIKSDEWLGGGLPWIKTNKVIPETQLWHPGDSPSPLWIAEAPSYLLLASEMLREGRMLAEMGWRDFEKLVGALLETNGWKIQITRGSKDGGIDVMAMRQDPEIGEIKSVWQAKKYRPSNKVRLSQVRELTAVREETRATKAMIVTTSALTRDAIEWIRRDTFRLGFKNQTDLARWIQTAVLEY